MERAQEIGLVGPGARKMGRHRRPDFVPDKSPEYRPTGNETGLAGISRLCPFISHEDAASAGFTSRKVCRTARCRRINRNASESGFVSSRAILGRLVRDKNRGRRCAPFSLRLSHKPISCARSMAHGRFRARSIIYDATIGRPDEAPPWQDNPSNCASSPC